MRDRNEPSCINTQHKNSRGFILFFLWSALIFMVVTCRHVNAADLQFSLGGGIWYNDVSGDIKYKNNPTIDIDILNYDTEIRPYVWAELTHPVPILPNLRLEYFRNEFSDRSSEDFYWEDVHFKADSYTKMQLKQFDMIAFYQITPLDWIALDLGLDVKYIKFLFEAEGLAQITGIINPVKVNYQIEEDNLFIPFPYTKLKLQVPGTGLEFEGEAKFIGYKNTTAYDLSIKASYFFNILAIQAGVEAGYRFEKLDLDQDDFGSIKFDADIDMYGPFTGIAVRF